MTPPTRGPQDHNLTVEIFRIQTALQAQGFQIQKQLQQPGWVIYRSAQQVYRLSYYPAPVERWILRPADHSPTRQHIVATIRTALNPTAPAPTAIAPTAHRPWTIVLIRHTLQRHGVALQRHTVARFRNRQDADDHLRAIRRYMPRAQFEVVFEPPQATKV